MEGDDGVEVSSQRAVTKKVRFEEQSGSGIAEGNISSISSILGNPPPFSTDKVVLYMEVGGNLSAIDQDESNTLEKEFDVVKGLVEGSMTSGSGEETQGELLSQWKIQFGGELMNEGDRVPICTTGEPIEGPRPSAQGQSSAPTWDETSGSTRPTLDNTVTPAFDFSITVPLEIEYPTMKFVSADHSSESGESVYFDNQVVIKISNC